MAEICHHRDLCSDSASSRSIFTTLIYFFCFVYYHLLFYLFIYSYIIIILELIFYLAKCWCNSKRSHHYLVRQLLLKANTCSEKTRVISVNEAESRQVDTETYERVIDGQR